MVETPARISETKLDVVTSSWMKSENREVITMNNPLPDYLVPYALSGTLVVVAAVIFGLHKALKLAGWPGPQASGFKRCVAARGMALCSAVAILVRTLPGGTLSNTDDSVWCPHPNRRRRGTVLAVESAQARH
jgi:hypothetical protein